MPLLLAVLLLLFIPGLLAADLPNTRYLAAQQSSPAASLDQASWITGHWRGRAWGGLTEEVWAPPLGGSMMGSFKYVLNDKVSFYELLSLQQQGDSLILKLKHFDSKLNGWEEKQQSVDFKLVAIEDKHLYFEGYTFERVSDNQMNVYVVMDNQGKKIETKFIFYRYTPPSAPTTSAQ